MELKYLNYDGDEYVNKKDYDTLEAELARVKEENKKLLQNVLHFNDDNKKFKAELALKEVDKGILEHLNSNLQSKLTQAEEALKKQSHSAQFKRVELLQQALSEAEERIEILKKDGGVDIVLSSKEAKTLLEAVKVMRGITADGTQGIKRGVRTIADSQEKEVGE